jgi:protoheme IX farnesyltransferase
LTALIETTKIGITRLVTMTAAVGFVMVALERIAGARADGATWASTWTGLGGWQFAISAAACLIGTALSAGGANTLNQWMEVHRDAKMQRTATRPIPSGRASGDRVLGFGVLLSVAGLAVLWLGCGLVAMIVSLACLVSYIVMYTPLKPVSPLATFVGAIPGALPPMIGSSAASALAGWDALREPAGLALFALMFVWQIPHFIALAWLYRDDYERGGFAVLPVMDTRGTMTAWTVFLWALVLIPATILPAAWSRGVVGVPYVVVAAVTGIGFAIMGWRFARERTRERARGVFLASVLHLPVLLLVMVSEGTVRAAG